MPTLRAALIRLAHAHPELRGDLLPLLGAHKVAAPLRFRDLPHAEDMIEGFQRITKVWSTPFDAEAALLRVLKDGEVRRNHRGSGKFTDSQQWFLSTPEGTPIQDPIHVFTRPGPRPGWVNFQVSL